MMKSASAPRGIKNQNSSLSSSFFREEFSRDKMCFPRAPNFFFHFLSSLSLLSLPMKKLINNTCETEQLHHEQS